MGNAEGLSVELKSSAASTSTSKRLSEKIALDQNACRVSTSSWRRPPCSVGRKVRIDSPCHSLRVLLIELAPASSSSGSRQSSLTSTISQASAASAIDCSRAANVGSQIEIQRRGFCGESMRNTGVEDYRGGGRLLDLRSQISDLR